MKRHFVSGLLFTALLLAACGRESAPRIELEPATLSFVAFNFIGNADDADEALIESFERRFETVTVERETYARSTLDYLSAEEPPDVLMAVPDENFKGYIESDLLAELSVVWDQAGLDPDSIGLDRLDPSGGGRYFLPAGFIWSGIYYNREIFERSGLTPPQTWEDFLTLCDTLLFQGEAPILIARSDNFALGLWFDYLNLRLNGADFHQRMLNEELPFTDARIRRVVETFRNLFTRGCIGSRAGGGGRLDQVTPLLRRDTETPLSSAKSAMGLLFAPGDSDLPAMFRDELDFFPFPKIEADVDRGEVVISIGYIVPSRAANIPHALAFLEHAVSPESQASVLQIYGGNEPYVPAHAGVDINLLSDQQKRGLALVQQDARLVLPSFWTRPASLRPAFTRLYRALYADEFDLDNLLEEMELARQ